MFRNGLDLASPLWLARKGWDHRQINVLPTALGRKRMLQIREDVQDQDAEKLIELLRAEAR